MGNERPWSVEEIIIVLYFTSRHILPNTLRYLLANRGHNRSTISIERIIKILLTHAPKFQFSNGQWNARAVDQYIDEQIYDHESVNHIIQFSFCDAEAVTNVSHAISQAPLFSLCIY